MRNICVRNSVWFPVTHTHDNAMGIVLYFHYNLLVAVDIENASETLNSFAFIELDGNYSIVKFFDTISDTLLQECEIEQVCDAPALVHVYRNAQNKITQIVAFNSVF